ncbi:hypothetical protein U27_01018 [Candidatus Vecturithrix granuli]|uniref:Uncharacterized protein n=1 Tax=Vecturithrix granuli TaxID=1499967 RepID=A0A081C965_VECG1|nr:hypothetical protein U27_01018 [Candidatus Vecturithrix granuli]
MKAFIGMDVLLGFDHKEGFFCLISAYYQDNSEPGFVSFYFVKFGSQYMLSQLTLDEAITANITLFLQIGKPVSALLAPKHGLRVEKIGTGNGAVTGSGIDCGEEYLRLAESG